MARKPLSAKHFDSLFVEASNNLKEVRVGDPSSHATTERALSQAQTIDLDTLSSLGNHPHFTPLLDFLQEQKENATYVLLERDATAQYNQVLGASLKIMLRETMFAKTKTQRDTYLSRVHEWYHNNSSNINNSNTNNSNNRRPNSNGVENPEEATLNESPERQHQRQLRAARYNQQGPTWKQPRPKSATTNVFLAGTTAGNEHEAAMVQQRVRTHVPPSSVLSVSRPASAAAARRREINRSGRSGGGGGGGSRPATAGASGGHRDGVSITGRLNQGGYMVRNLFRSQRHRISSHVLSRAQKRKQLSDIQKAELLHRADVNESLRSHQHLLKEKTTVPNRRQTFHTSGPDGGATNTAQRPKSAVPARRASGGSASGGTTTSNKRPASASNVHKYPTSSTPSTSSSSSSSSSASSASTAAPPPPSTTQPPGQPRQHRARASSPVVSLRQARERDQWLEETWLRGRSLDAADERNQAEITAAMQQWAMNRGRIEEEIMRRQESRR